MRICTTVEKYNPMRGAIRFLDGSEEICEVEVGVCVLVADETEYVGIVAGVDCNSVVLGVAMVSFVEVCHVEVRRVGEEAVVAGMSAESRWD